MKFMLFFLMALFFQTAPSKRLFINKQPKKVSSISSYFSESQSEKKKSESSPKYKPDLDSPAFLENLKNAKFFFENKEYVTTEIIKESHGGKPLSDSLLEMTNIDMQTDKKALKLFKLDWDDPRPQRAYEMIEFSKHQHCPFLVQLYSYKKFKSKNMEFGGVIMEFIEGISGKKYDYSNLSKDMILKLIESLLEGLLCLHRNEKFHFDFKPENFINGPCYRKCHKCRRSFSFEFFFPFGSLLST